jgi:hypothetical protein
MPAIEEFLPSPTVWRLLYGNALDDRINLRADVVVLRADPHVQGVEFDLDASDPEHFVINVTLIPGQSTLHSNELQQRFARQISYEDEAEEEASPPRGFRSFLDQQFPNLDPNAIQRLISESIGSTEGRRQLASSMIQPLRARMDYQSLGRRTFLVEQLPDGALPIYDRDPEVSRILSAEPPLSTGLFGFNQHEQDLDPLPDWSSPPLPDGYEVGKWVESKKRKFLGLGGPEIIGEIKSIFEGTVTLTLHEPKNAVHVMHVRELGTSFTLTDDPTVRRTVYEHLLDDEIWDD